MTGPGTFRERIAETLKDAYGDGLLSESTLAHRLDMLGRSRLIDPARLLGDLTLRRPASRLAATLDRVRAVAREMFTAPWRRDQAPPTLLALDWDGGHEELSVGRHPSNDIVLEQPSVSRRHARLWFRDGAWMLQDLESTNGTLVNDESVVRCRLLPGDIVRLGDVRLLVD